MIRYSAHCICHPCKYVVDTLNYQNYSTDVIKEFAGKNVNSFKSDDHLKPEFKSYADHWRKNVWIPFEGDLALDDIFKGYQKYAEKYNTVNRGLAFVDGPVYTAAWAGRPDKAREYLDWVEFIVNKYGEIPVGFDGGKRWKERIEFYIDRPELLRQFARSIVQRRGMGNSPYFEIKDATYQELIPYDPRKDPFVPNKLIEEYAQLSS